MAAGSDPNTFTNWTSGYVDFRYLKGRITYTGITAGNVSMVADFTILAAADVAPFGAAVGNAQTVHRRAGPLSPSRTLTTPPPYVTATVDQRAADSFLSASVASVTRTD